MYEATKAEQKILIEPPYDYNIKILELLEAESDRIRKGIPVDFETAFVVSHYQSDLQEIRKSQKKWWYFWK